MFPDAKVELLLESDRTDDPGGIIHKAHVVKDADRSVFQIAEASEEIHHLSEFVWIQPNGQGVDGKIPPVKIQLDGTPLHHGVCAW